LGTRTSKRKAAKEELPPEGGWQVRAAPQAAPPDGSNGEFTEAAIYRLVVENSGDLIVVFDRDAQIKFASPSFGRVLGYEPDEIVGLPGLTLVHPDDLERVQEAMLQTITSGGSFVSRVRIRRKDGGWVRMEAVGNAIRNAQGDPESILAVVRDISAEVEAEATERRLSAQYRVAAVLAGAETLEAAAAPILEAIGTTLGWEVGALWRVDPAEEVLRCVDVWRADDVAVPGFEQATRVRTFQRGIGLPGRAWAAGEPIWVPDVVVDDNFPRASAAKDEGIHGAFAFPILLADQAMGVLEFFSREIKEVDQDLLWAIAASGSQIGQFIQRREAEAEREEILRRERAARGEANAVSVRLQGFQKITDVVVAQHSTDELLTHLLDAARAALQTDTATVLLLSPDRKNLVVRAVSGDEEEARGQVRVPYGQGIAGQVAASRTSRIVDDVPHAHPYSGFLRRKVKSMMLAPLEVGERVLGVMHVAMFTAHQFSEEDLQLLRVMADRAAVAIENTRLYEAERQARAEAEAAQLRLAFLAEAGTVLAGSLRLGEALERLARLAVDFLTDICLIDLSDDEGVRRVVALHSDQRKQALTDLLKERYAPDPNGPHPAVWVMREGRSRFSPEMTDEFLKATSRDEEHFLITKELGFQSYMCVPLVAAGRALGTFTLVSTDPDRRYGPADVALAEDLALRAGQAVENARLYAAAELAGESAQRAASRTLVLQSLTAALSEAVTSEDVARVVIDRALPVVGADAGSVVVLGLDEKTLDVLVAEGYPEDEPAPRQAFSLDARSPLAEATRTGEPVLVRTAADWKRYPPEARMRATPDAPRTWVAVPMVVEGTAVGAMGLAFPEPRALGEDELAFLLALARQCGQALDRTRLFDAEQRARRDAEVARRRLLFLSEASEVFSASLDSDIVLQSLARLVVPQLADWSIVDELSDGQEIRQTAVSHVTPSMETLARELRNRYPPDPDAPHVVWRVLTTGDSELAPEVTEEELRARARDDMHFKLLTQLGIRSHIVVPLKARGRILGALSLISTSRRYGPDDLALAEELAARAALAVDNARLYQQQLHAASALQRSLLPPALPEIPGIELASRYRAAGEATEVGGDFYDMFDAGNGSWAVVIGDVCGKGPEAAAVTGLARHTIRATAIHEDRPSAVLDQLNRAMLQQVPDGRFCTVCYARVRTAESGARVTVSSGGHPLPLVLRYDGAVETVGRPGRLLGVFPETGLSDQAVDLHRGDSMILFTDGVTEQVREGVPFGVERLEAAIQAAVGEDANGIADAIERAVFESGGSEARDDVAIVVLRIPPGGGPD
jgi:PAS domain S-box-containing protein